jgi:hypothetical protein
MDEIEYFIGIEKALKSSLVLTVWRSGSGLRIATIEDPTAEEGKRLKGYGSMPNLRPALLIASYDYLAGFTDEPKHYLTGSQQPEETLDEWVLRGNKLFAEMNDGQVKLEARTGEKEVLSIKALTFHEAYKSLEKKVKKELKDFNLYHAPK